MEDRNSGGHETTEIATKQPSTVLRIRYQTITRWSYAAFVIGLIAVALGLVMPLVFGVK